MIIFKKVFENINKKRPKKREQSQKEKAFITTQKRIKKQLTFTKIALGFVLINSELQIWASYILAFLGKDAIAEALSQQIVITIIGTMVGYFVKSLIENLSKYTTLFGKNLENNGNIQEPEIILNSDIMQTEVCNDTLTTSMESNNSLMCDGITPIHTDEL